jgi:hypothetical protein
MNATVICLLLLSLAGTARCLAAQDAPTAAVAGAPQRVHPGEAVWVTTSGGSELNGIVLSVSVSSLEITGANGNVSMPLSDITRIETRDSLKNGARNGALIGAISLGIYVGALSHGLRCERDCGTDYSATRDTLEGVAFGIGVGAGGGALIGLFVDRLVKGRRLVYDVTQKRSRSWQIRPTIAKGQLEVSAVVRWP